jgi:hypothetical protein
MEPRIPNGQEPQGLGRVVDLLAAEQAILERAKRVSQSILERVREVTGDTQESVALSLSAPFDSLSDGQS